MRGFMKSIISKGNKKTGNIPSFNLPPVVTCGKYAKYCKDWCYCNRAFSFKGARNMWENNVEISKKKSFVKRIVKETSNFKYFRIHVSGDFYSVEYLQKWIAIAKLNPTTKFLAFTKQFNVLETVAKETTDFPKNLKIILSTTPNMEKEVKETIYFLSNEYGFSVSSIEEKVDFYKNFECDSICSECLACWNTSKNTNIVLKWHGNFKNIGFEWHGNKLKKGDKNGKK